MNSTRGKIIIVSAVLAVIALGFILYPYLISTPPPPTEFSSDTTNVDVKEELENLPLSDEFRPDVEIQFSKSLHVKDRTVSIDNGEFQRVPCNGTNGKPEFLGYIKENERQLDLVCINDYMGGISLQFEDADGKTTLMNLARTEGDAGDLWETRSVLTKTDEGLLHIDTITLTSSQDLALAEQPQDIPPPVCEEQRFAFSWDPKMNTFIETIPSKNFEIEDFHPPIAVDDGCLNKQGQWAPDPS